MISVPNLVPNDGVGDGQISLFRRESIAEVNNLSFGQPIASLPFSWKFLSSSMFVMLVTFMTFLFFGTYTRKEAVTGVVRSSGGEVRVASEGQGIVKDVLVADGQHVRTGQALLTVDTSRNGVNGSAVDQALVNNLDRELLNLKVRLQSFSLSAAIETKGMPARLAALKEERSAAIAQERSATERLAMAQSALLKLEPVASRGFISGEAMRHHKDEVLVLQQTIADARGSKARLNGQIDELENLTARQPMLQQQQRGELLDLIARTQRDRDTATGQQGFAVTAPAAGVVTTVQTGRGQPVSSQETLMTISTSSSNMLAEAFVPSRAVGFIEPGQKVRLRYDAFPYQHFGVGHGYVKAISSNVLRPDQIAATIHIEEPVYRVVIALDQDSLSAYGHRYPIRPGFALTADIVLDRRTFAQWLLDPITALRGRL